MQIYFAVSIPIIVLQLSLDMNRYRISIKIVNGKYLKICQIIFDDSRCDEFYYDKIDFIPTQVLVTKSEM